MAWRLGRRMPWQYLALDAVPVVDPEAGQGGPSRGEVALVWINLREGEAAGLRRARLLAAADRMEALLCRLSCSAALAGGPEGPVRATAGRELRSVVLEARALLREIDGGGGADVPPGRGEEGREGAAPVG